MTKHNRPKFTPPLYATLIRVDSILQEKQGDLLILSRSFAKHKPFGS